MLRIKGMHAADNGIVKKMMTAEQQHKLQLEKGRSHTHKTESLFSGTPFAD